MSYQEQGAPVYAQIRRVKSGEGRGKKRGPYKKKAATAMTAIVKRSTAKTKKATAAVAGATEKTVKAEKTVETTCAVRMFVLESLYLSALADKEANEDAFAVADTSLAVDSGVSDGLVHSTVVVDTADRSRPIQTKAKRIWE
jgi:hypothetical protein